MNILPHPIIDCHVHILDPDRFTYAADAWYAPIGAERGTAVDLTALMNYHGVRHALLVAPNSGYNLDNRCMLDAIANSGGKFKGMALVKHNTCRAELEDLKAQGIAGVAMNVSLLGVDFYANIEPLLGHLRDLDMWAQMQVQHDQLVTLKPMLEASGAKLLFDHCGRPDPMRGTDQAGFEALLTLASTGRAVVKLSGFSKCSNQHYPWRDAKPFVSALIDAFTPERLVWASDWPFLKAPARIDYGPLLALFEQLVPDPLTRQKIQFDTPKRLFEF